MTQWIVLEFLIDVKDVYCFHYISIFLVDRNFAGGPATSKDLSVVLPGTFYTC